MNRSLNSYSVAAVGTERINTRSSSFPRRSSRRTRMSRRSCGFLQTGIEWEYSTLESELCDACHHRAYLLHKPELLAPYGVPTTFYAAGSLGITTATPSSENPENMGPPSSGGLMRERTEGEARSPQFRKIPKYRLRCPSSRAIHWSCYRHNDEWIAG
jgi:hypothetical protein